MKRGLALVVFILIVLQGAFSQSFTGAGNYNGIDLMAANPSAPVFSRLEFDIRLFSAEAFAVNNFISTQSIYADEVFYQKRSQGRVFANIDLTGPSALFVLKKYAWGIKTSFKTMLCTNAFNEGINDLIYRSINNESVSGLNLDLKDNKQTNALSYYDITVNYSRIVHDNSNSIVSIGYSGKLLSGLDALSLTTLNNRSIHQGDSTFKVADAQYAYAFPDPSQHTGLFDTRGIGIGSDIGFTYLKRLNRKNHPLRCASFRKKYPPLREYKWKLGVAIIDIGSIQFNTEASQKMFTLVRAQLDTLRFRDIRNVYHFDSLLVQNVLPTGSVLEDKTFYAGLPTTLTVQFDHFLKIIFLSIIV